MSIRKVHERKVNTALDKYNHYTLNFISYTFFFKKYYFIY
jgi:hypothetical protein